MNDVLSILIRLKNYYKVNTHKELADKIGVSINTIGTWTKRKKIPIKKLRNISIKNNIPLDKLLGINERGALVIGDFKEDDVLHKALSFFDWGGMPILAFPKLNKNVILFICRGGAMQPNFNDGERIFVDTSLKELEDNKVYLFKIGKDYFLRRVAIDGGVIFVKSDYEVHGQFIFKDSYEIIGKVIYRVEEI